MKSSERLRILGDAKVAVEAVQTKIDADKAASRETSRMLQAQKQRWSSEVTQQIIKSVTSANSDLRGEGLSEIYVEGSQGTPEFQLIFSIKSLAPKGTFGATASLRGSDVVVSYTRAHDRHHLGTSTYELDNIDPDRVVNDILEAYVALQKTIA